MLENYRAMHFHGYKTFFHMNFHKIKVELLMFWHGFKKFLYMNFEIKNV